MNLPKVIVQFETEPQVAKFLIALYTVYDLALSSIDQTKLGNHLILDHLPSALMYLSDILSEEDQALSNLNWTTKERQYMKDHFGCY